MVVQLQALRQTARRTTMSDLDNTPRAKRFLQTVSDLSGGDVSNLNVLDLGCAHGLYSLELARRGARTLGVEGRKSWLAQANQMKADGKLSGANFVQGDVRDLNPNKYGTFDVVLCLGLLYHLDAADALRLLKTSYDVCNKYVLIDTQIAVEPAESREIDGEIYWGSSYREHAERASTETKEATLGASLDDEFSFWFTRPSLLNALRVAGFTSVFEVRNPIDNVYAHGEFKMHADVITLVAMKGKPIGGFLGASAQGQAEAAWPEDIAPFTLHRPWSKPPQATRI
jgi:SAM-dependent methyltransferase